MYCYPRGLPDKVIRGQALSGIHSFVMPEDCNRASTGKQMDSQLLYLGMTSHGKMPINMFRTRLLILLFILLPSTSSLCDEEEVANLIFQAHEANKPIPVISDKYPRIDIQTAYLIQKEYLLKRLENDQIAGYKAGLTSTNIQKKLGVESPVLGVLFASGRRGEESIIDSSKFITPMIETEVGFIIGKAVTHPINDLSELIEHVSAVVPVIEIPDLGFEENKKPKVIDIIASNVSAAEFIVGESKKKLHRSQ